MSELQYQNIWATPIVTTFWDAHPQHASSIVEHLYEQRKRETENIASGVAPGAKSAHGLYESKFDLFNTKHPGLRALMGWIGDALSHVVVQVNSGQEDPKQVRVSAVDSWCHITNDSGFHDAHHHHGCSWCGVYYLQAGDAAQRDNTDNGLSRFYSPVLWGGLYLDHGNRYLSQRGYYTLRPQDGMMVLFPSYLLHSGLPYRGEKDRIVIAFNCQVFRA